MEYIPDNSVTEESSYFELNKLAEDAEKLLNSNEYTKGSLSALYKHGGSSGGARPKVFLSIDAILGKTVKKIKKEVKEKTFSE